MPTSDRPTSSSQPRARRATAAAGAIAAALTLTVVLAGPAAALTPVTQRSVLDVPRIDGLTSAALPDGRVLMGWTDGTNSGDTTLAAVRPSGGVLPPTYQTLRTGYSSDSVEFITGGPAEYPVLTSFHPGPGSSPFLAKLDGDLFTTQIEVFGGSYMNGRFPEWARCPDRSTVFSYQYTYPGSPQTYAAAASTGDAKGKLSGGGSSLTPSQDAFQDSRVQCDQGIPTWTTANDPDGDGAAQGEQLRVARLGAGGGIQLQRTLAPGVGASSPDTRVAPGGRLWMVWTEYTGSTATSYFATRAPGWTGNSGFTTGTALANAEAGELFFDAAGNTHVIIYRSTMGTTSLGIRTAAAGQATFGPEQVLVPPTPGALSLQLLTQHPDGNPRLLVGRSTGAPDYLRSYELRGIPQAGSGAEVTPVSGFGHNGGSATASFLLTGDLFLAAPHENAPNSISIREGGLDTGAPPTFSSVIVPGLAAPGEAIPLQIDAHDPLGLASFSWTVDGQTLTDQDTSFAFSKAGTYVVTARATDRAGNSSELTRTVRVLDPAAVTPGSPEFAAAVTAAGGTLTARDTTAPTLTKGTAIRGRKGKAKAKATVSITANEPVSADLELIGTLKRGKDSGVIQLRSARIAAVPAGQATSRNLAIPASLAKLVKSKLSVRITLTDAAGNRTVKTVKVKNAKK